MEYNNCDMQLDHNTNVIPVTGLYMFIVMMLGIPRFWKRLCGLKPFVLFKVHLIV